MVGIRRNDLREVVFLVWVLQLNPGRLVTGWTLAQAVVVARIVPRIVPTTIDVSGRYLLS